MRHAIFAHRDFDFHARVIEFSQHLFDAAHRLTVQAGQLGQLDHHHLTDLGLSGGCLGNQNVLAIALVFGGHQPNAPFLQQTPNDGLGWPFDDFHHAALRPALAIESQHPHLDAVQMQHGAHLIGCQKYVCRAIISAHKTVSVAVTQHGAFDFLQQTCAGVTELFDRISLFPEMPRWRNW